MYSPMKFTSLCPFVSVLFIIWSNSSYVSVGKNVGFFCNDTSINKPYHGDSISALNLFISLLFGPAVIIFLTESYFRAEDCCNASDSKFRNHMKYFYAGFVYVLTVTEILKLFSSELRPHFFQTCQPNVDHIKCANGLVTEFTCTGSGPKWLIDRDIYKSFPSGHASLSFYTFVFFCVYVHKKSNQMSRSFAVLWKFFILLLCLSWTIICCISRLLDHRHFWWDVVAGIIIGLLGGLLIGNVSSKKHHGKTA